MPSANIPIPPDRPTDGWRLFYGEKIRHVSPLRPSPSPLPSLVVLNNGAVRCGADGDLLSISLVQIIHLLLPRPNRRSLAGSLARSLVGRCYLSVSHLPPFLPSFPSRSSVFGLRSAAVLCCVVCSSARARSAVCAIILMRHLSQWSVRPSVGRWLLRSRPLVDFALSDAAAAAVLRGRFCSDGEAAKSLVTERMRLTSDIYEYPII